MDARMGTVSLSTVKPDTSATEEAVTEPALCRPKDELPPPPRKLLSLEERLPLFDETDAVGVVGSLGNSDVGEEKDGGGALLRKSRRSSWRSARGARSSLATSLRRGGPVPADRLAVLPFATRDKVEGKDGSPLDRLGDDLCDCSLFAMGDVDDPAGGSGKLCKSCWLRLSKGFVDEVRKLLASLLPVCGRGFCPAGRCSFGGTLGTVSRMARLAMGVNVFVAAPADIARLTRDAEEADLLESPIILSALLWPVPQPGAAAGDDDGPESDVAQGGSLLRKSMSESFPRPCLALPFLLPLRFPPRGKPSRHSSSESSASAPPPAWLPDSSSMSDGRVWRAERG